MKRSSYKLPKLYFHYRSCEETSADFQEHISLDKLYFQRYRVSPSEGRTGGIPITIPKNWLVTQVPLLFLSSNEDPEVYICFQFNVNITDIPINYC